MRTIRTVNKMPASIFDRLRWEERITPLQTRGDRRHDRKNVGGQGHFTGSHGAVLIASLILVALLSGCKRSRTGAHTRYDPYREAFAEMEDPGERPYIEASRPILDAIVARDYRRLYEMMSDHALESIGPEQFGPIDEDDLTSSRTALTSVTLDQFLEQMAVMEARLGTPCALSGLYVQSIDPTELAGGADAMDNLFIIGAMPATIPPEIRRASVRARIVCQLPDKRVRQIAEELGISEERVRARDLPPNDHYDSTDWPYLTFKFVFVEQDSHLKIGYFEFLPPSLFD